MMLMPFLSLHRAALRRCNERKKMNIKKLDFRVNLGVDDEFEKALDAARMSRRMTKTDTSRTRS